VYRIAPDEKNPGQFKIDADKIVNGSPIFMGTLVCLYKASTLSCTGNTGHLDDWEFHVSGDTMTGTLTIGSEKKLYRRITLHRNQTKAD
jgi:hypothetical protein